MVSVKIECFFKSNECRYIENSKGFKNFQAPLYFLTKRLAGSVHTEMCCSGYFFIFGFMII